MTKSKIITAILFLGLLLFYACESENKNQEQAEKAIGTTEEDNTNNKYQLIGQDFAQQTQTSLAKELKNAIGEKGFPGAITFCNIKALPIIDSMSRALNAKIKRVSDQPRNRTNQAKEGELFYIDMCKNALANNKELKPFVSEDEKHFTGYYPIVTNQLCLNCHGSTKDIGAETLAKINSLYPEDKAQGYKANEVRGLFVVEIDK